MERKQIYERVLKLISIEDGLNGCWNFRGKTKNGYGRIQINGNDMYLHRLMFETYYGRVPTVCRHTCDNPLCCNPSHLVDGTIADNMLDKQLRGRASKKLSAEAVAIIKSSTLSNSKLAKMFNVSQPLSSQIKNAKWWQHITSR